MAVVFIPPASSGRWGRLSSVRLAGKVLPLLAQLREERPEPRHGAQPLEMRVVLEVREVREAVVRGVLDPLLRAVHVSQPGVDRTDRVGRVVEVQEALADADRVRDVSLGAAPITGHGAQHAARGVEDAPLIDRILHERAIDDRARLVEAAQ